MRVLRDGGGVHAHVHRARPGAVPRRSAGSRAPRYSASASFFWKQSSPSAGGSLAASPSLAGGRHEQELSSGVGEHVHGHPSVTRRVVEAEEVGAACEEEGMRPSSAGPSSDGMEDDIYMV